jgi:hypothetical protein
MGMRALRKSLWTIAAILALPAPAAAQDVCAALQRIVAAAGEAVPFDSVRKASAAGEPVVPGFAPQECDVAAAAVSCSHRSGGGVVTFDSWPRTLACDGFELVASEGAGPRNRDWTRTYRAGALRIEFGSACRACAGPGYSWFEARLEPRRRPEQ